MCIFSFYITFHEGAMMEQTQEEHNRLLAAINVLKENARQDILTRQQEVPPPPRPR
jgi:hypothetical protein